MLLLLAILAGRLLELLLLLLVNGLLVGIVVAVVLSSSQDFNRSCVPFDGQVSRVFALGKHLVANKGWASGHHCLLEEYFVVNEAIRGFVANQFCHEAGQRAARLVAGLLLAGHCKRRKKCLPSTLLSATFSLIWRHKIKSNINDDNNNKINEMKYK